MPAAKDPLGTRGDTVEFPRGGEVGCQGDRNLLDGVLAIGGCTSGGRRGRLLSEGRVPIECEGVQTWRSGQSTKTMNAIYRDYRK